MRLHTPPEIHCGNCGIADDTFHVTDEDCERARQKEDKMIVRVFEHEVAYEGSSKCFD